MKHEAIIEEGVFINYCDQKEYPYCFKLLDKSDIEPMLSLQNKTYENLIDKDIYVPGSRETLMKDLTGEGLTGGIFAGEKLIAFSSAHFMQYDKSFSDIEPVLDVPLSDFKKVVRYRYTSVDPEFIRNGLSTKIATWLNNHIQEDFPDMQYFISMVSPRNYPSLKQQTELKLYGRKFKQNSVGLNRIILFKDVRKNIEINNTRATTIASTEDELIRKAFDEGYLLIETIFKKNNIYLIFSI